jgi:putative Mg2+ transporter-C (MgtC) family protein
MPFWEIIFALILAGLLGAILGFQRESSGKAAGMRTFSLVSVGAALFTMLSKFGFESDMTDPSRIASYITVGVGFIGAGVIMKGKADHVVGLTTAAGLWVVAAIGLTVGAGWYATAIVTTLLALLIFYIDDDWIRKNILGK